MEKKEGFFISHSLPSFYLARKPFLPPARKPPPFPPLPASFLGQPTRASWPLLRASPASAPAQHRSNCRRSFPLSTRPHPSALPLTSSRPTSAPGQATSTAPPLRTWERLPPRPNRYKWKPARAAFPCCFPALSRARRARKPPQQQRRGSPTAPPRGLPSLCRLRLLFSPG